MTRFVIWSYLIEVVAFAGIFAVAEPLTFGATVGLYLLVCVVAACNFMQGRER
jgi:hypothetical protein